MNVAELKNCPVCGTPARMMVHDGCYSIKPIAPRWISVKERLPKHGSIVFCYTKYFYEVLQWDDDAEQWVGQYSVNAKHYVTHWMPLPEAPKEE